MEYSFFNKNNNHTATLKSDFDQSIAIKGILIR